MTQPIAQESIVTSLPISFLKEILKSADDEHLARFLHGYAIGSAAEQFIAIMNEPGQRAEFLVAVAKTYPDDWKEALNSLGDSLVSK